MNIIKSANIALTFFIELAMLFAFGYFGFQAGQGIVLKWLLGLGLPLLVAILWGAFFAPKAARRFSTTPGVLLSSGLFLLAALALYLAQQPLAALILAVSAVVNRALAFFWRQW
jgi:hypothetical protein